LKTNRRGMCDLGPAPFAAYRNVGVMNTAQENPKRFAPLSSGRDRFITSLIGV